MARLMTTEEFVDCLPTFALERLLTDVRAIEEPMARAVQRDVERLIEKRLKASSARRRRDEQPAMFER